MDENNRLLKRRAYMKGYMAGYHRGIEDSRAGKTETQTETAFLDRPIQFLNLSVRPFNSLDRAGYRRIRDIVSLDQQEIQKIRGLGIQGLREVAGALWDYGIRDSGWNEWRYSE